MFVITKFYYILLISLRYTHATSYSAVNNDLLYNIVMECISFNPESAPKTDPTQEEITLMKEAGDVETGMDKEKSPEKIKVKPTLTLVVPEGFELDRREFESTIWGIANRRVNSIEAMRQRGWDYDECVKTYPTPIEIQMGEIEGTENVHGWGGLIEGLGEEVKPPIARLQTLDTAFSYAEEILKMEPPERNKLLSKVDLVELEGYGSRQFFIDADGRHRMLTLKVLSELGCYVSVSGVKTSKLTKFKSK